MKKNKCSGVPEINSILVPTTGVGTEQDTELSQIADDIVAGDISPPDNSVVDIHSLDEEALLLSQLNQPIEERPFQLLNKDLLQLTNEAASLRKHPDYKVLTHIAWRQPVLSKTEALSIRIAGGQDLSSSFKYDGNSRLSTIEGTVQTPVEPSENQDYLELENNHFNIESELLPSNNSATKNSITFNKYVKEDKINNISLPLATPNLWVPELDGNIKIHLNRFLHITTDLFLRKPGKEEIEVVDLDLYSPELLSSFTVGSSEPLLPSEIEDSTVTSILSSPFESSLSSNETEKQVDSSVFADEKKNQFSWEISDDFLESESEKIYIERLFNYSLKQSRKVRSGELHFFDHPLLGLFIIVRPYELPTEVIDDTSEVAISN